MQSKVSPTNPRTVQHETYPTNGCRTDINHVLAEVPRLSLHRAALYIQLGGCFAVPTHHTPLGVCSCTRPARLVKLYRTFIYRNNNNNKKKKNKQGCGFRLDLLLEKGSGPHYLS